MNSKEAIEIKQAYHSCHSQDMTPEERLADNISIEALKRHKNIQENPRSPYYAPLPGETEN